jgi:hypothetical protein
MSIETEEAVIEEAPAPELEAEQPEQEAAAPAPEEPEEVIVTIGDEQPAEEEEQPSKNWVNELRKKNREDQKRIRELESQAPADAAAAGRAAFGAEANPGGYGL